MDDKDLKRYAIIGGAVLLGVAVLNQIYQSGFNAGLAATGEGGRYHGDGFFPFPGLLLVAGAIWFFCFRRRGRGNGGHWPGVQGQNRPPRLFEDWHNRAHQADVASGGSGGPHVPQSPNDLTEAPAAPAAPPAQPPQAGGTPPQMPPHNGEMGQRGADSPSGTTGPTTV